MDPNHVSARTNLRHRKLLERGRTANCMRFERTVLKCTHSVIVSRKVTKNKYYMQLFAQIAVREVLSYEIE